MRVVLFKKQKKCTICPPKSTIYRETTGTEYQYCTVSQSVSQSYTTPIHGVQRSQGRTQLQTTICSLNLLVQFSTCNRTAEILTTDKGDLCGLWVRLTGRVDKRHPKQLCARMYRHSDECAGRTYMRILCGVSAQPQLATCCLFGPAVVDDRSAPDPPAR